MSELDTLIQLLAKLPGSARVLRGERRYTWSGIGKAY